MKFRYCPDCGERLELRDLGDEVDVPFCTSCQKPWFQLFPSAVIALVYNDRGEVLLLSQSYISTRFRNLVSGYIIPGESAEECVRREVKEETGIDIDGTELVMTHWFARKEMMMIGFFAHASRTELALSSEVEEAGWYPAKSILQYLSTSSGSTSRILAERFLTSANTWK